MEARRVRNLFLTLFGVIFAAAFWSLHNQVLLLFGADGLAPACRALRAQVPKSPWWSEPTLFRLVCDDTALRVGTIIGTGLGCLLALRIAPLFCLAGLWLLYLSYVTIGSPFLDFQWDNLLLETAFFSLFLAPWSRRGSQRAPSPWAIFLMQWLLFRLHFESGVAKLASGDPTWRDLTAMVSYYETAPLPTWLGWYAHQLPEWSQRLTSGLTLVVELIVPFFLWGPRPLRWLALISFSAFQTIVLLTANYTIFNYLSLALCLFVLVTPGGTPLLGSSRTGAIERARWFGPMAPIAVVLVGLTLLPFLRVVGSGSGAAASVAEAIAPLRTFNAYHLFASMTLVRREAVIEGSDDGVDWRPYEFRYKPGDPLFPPTFVAPHQPRVDFQLWFLLLGRRGAPYFDRLLRLLLENPSEVRPLFRVDPFPDHPPAMLRVAIYRYRFTNPQTKQETGAWWDRTLESHTRTLTRDSFG